MSKEISIESLYANGMGIELPINNNDTKQAQESYPCSNIIDNSYITNSLEYLEYHSIIEKNNTKDMIKLNKKLNDHYGKYNKSLENYLINNANTSKENYNNYINTNKELYNELIMSRENHIIKIGGIILSLPILLSLIIKAIKKIGKIKTEKVEKNKINKILKDKEILKGLIDLTNEFKNIERYVSTINYTEFCEKLTESCKLKFNDSNILYNFFMKIFYYDDYHNSLNSLENQIYIFLDTIDSEKKNPKLKDRRSTINYITPIKIFVQADSEDIEKEKKNKEIYNALNDKNFIKDTCLYIHNTLKKTNMRYISVYSDTFIYEPDNNRYIREFGVDVHFSKDYSYLIDMIIKKL